MEGKPRFSSFLSQAEVDALLRGVTSETEPDPRDDVITEAEWEESKRQAAQEAYDEINNFSEMKTIELTSSQIQRLQTLLANQRIADFYDIYHILTIAASK